MSTAIPDLYDFLRGPGFVISISVFLSGMAFRMIQLIRATRKIDVIRLNGRNILQSVPAPEKETAAEGILTGLRSQIRNTVFFTNPVIGVTSLVFHILIFITPVFLAAHNIISDMTTGISLFAFPERLSDIFTVLIILSGVFFLARRIFIPEVRILSTFRDYFLLIVVIAPFASAFMAYHHFFNYRIAVFSHMIIGELALMAVPFTGLVHMLFSVFSRFFIDNEYSIVPGNRRW